MNLTSKVNRKKTRGSSPEDRKNFQITMLGYNVEGLIPIYHLMIEELGDLSVHPTEEMSCGVLFSKEYATTEYIQIKVSSKICYWYRKSGQTWESNV